MKLTPESYDESPKRRRTLSRVLIGPAKDLRDPQLFHSLSLVAFLAWVGLGSDGLSSSCYWPEEAFLALGTHQYLAVFLALLMALTVFIISASYSQTIDSFPAGGGGYLVATKLLGTYPGLVSGCALIVDYVLTIAISIASGADAIFSFLPAEWLPAKFFVAIAVVALMVAMNLRGIKESVLALVPVFLAFVGLHLVLICYAVLGRAAELPAIAHDAVRDARQGFDALGVVGLAIIFFRAYSMGAGTYTGIEAVSNGLPILREPRTTGKRTMLYMALSLAFIAGGILIAYLLAGVEPKAGKTLNAVLFENLTANWSIAGISISMPIVTMTLLTEGALLFVAAQTGFVGGPQVLATMALDRWVPRRFSNLSERLVTQDGVLAMGMAALLVLLGTHARVRVLVILYAINVFVTFTLSQLGMSALWWRERSREPQWLRKFLINGVGCVFTALILILTVTLKFDEGGWVTVTITGGVVALCYLVRRHYLLVTRAVDQLEADLLPDIYAAASVKVPVNRDPNAPTAVLLVNGFNGLGLATLMKIPRLFKGQFHNVIFVSVGEVDASLLKGQEEVDQLEHKIADDMLEYCRLATDLGFHAETRTGIGADVVMELRRLCLEVAQIFPHAVFFAGQLVFSEEVDAFFSRFLHNRTALDLLRWLQLYGLSLVILPVRVASTNSLKLLPLAADSRAQPLESY